MGCLEARNPSTHPSLDVSLQELQALEPLIYAANGGRDRAYFEALLAPDFWEIGASGQRYDRAFVLSVLEARQAQPIEETWHAYDHRLQAIAPQNYLLAYTLRQPTRLSRRASIWRQTPSGWRMVYHQGTVMIDPPHEAAPA